MLDALHRAFNFTTQIVGLGPHGLLRLMTSDWDDGFHPPASGKRVAESVLTSALASYTFARFAIMARLAGDPELAGRANAFGTELSHALLAEAWNGLWLRRAWLGPGSGWAGDIPDTNGTLPGYFSAPLGWALLAGTFDHEPRKLALTVARLNRDCREGWQYGYAYRCVPGQLPPGSGSW